ncbi:hypothetical protein [Methylobacterium sp. SyP6R]|uniref:hypothetical protein n=1 Tax=Methylobacterium sp. SyP6R TaxID=2718876 RepID=UPI001F2270E1|nr:hypothetical protein [Methylobacterium sp. SyP6R]MCF4124872.1 hypothetical protein [Methylobacterium sp. SyP6R]
MVNLSVKQGDVINHVCDMLVLKYADRFHGADAVVADLISFSGPVQDGSYSILQGIGIGPKKVMFVGVGPLAEFRYSKIHSFAYNALASLRHEKAAIRTIATTIHGPGYGLDESESFLSLISGFYQAIQEKLYPGHLEEITIVERAAARASHLTRLLDQKIGIKPLYGDGQEKGASRKQVAKTSSARDIAINKKLASYGAASENKIKLFVAMPFKSDFSDEFDIAITEAVENNGILCERMDQQSYIGDILQNIKERIEKFDGVLALLNESNPNVFLELGYAWAKGKPAVLMLKEGSDLPFDVGGQRCIVYKNIGDLRKRLTIELKNLKEDGVFSKSKGGR